MSRNGIIVLVIVVVLVLLGAWYYFGQSNVGSSSQTGSATTSTETTSLPTGTDTSDAALQTDLKSMDTQMGNFGSDSTSINDSVTAEQSPAQQ